MQLRWRWNAKTASRFLELSDPDVVSVEGRPVDPLIRIVARLFQMRADGGVNWLRHTLAHCDPIDDRKVKFDFVAGLRGAAFPDNAELFLTPIGPALREGHVFDCDFAGI